MSVYYVADGKIPRGPFSLDQLVSRGLPGDTLVWKAGMSRWRPAHRVEELIFAGVLHAAPAPPPVEHFAGLFATAASAGPVYHPGIINTNRLAAGLCGILLGGFGIHKFVLGMPGAGALMLLLTVVGGFLTCGAVSAVMGVIGLIEGVVYLTRNDTEFYELYMVQKKAWF